MGKHEVDLQDWDFIRELVRSRSAIILEPEKNYLLQSRLEPVAKRERISSIGTLVAKLRETAYSPLHQQVVEAMTTNETSFFRDDLPFRVLKDKLLPEIISRKARTKTLNIWCGASASGQEPYSVLLILLESFPQLRSWQVEFVATDISDEMVARCQKGVYSPLEISRGLPEALLRKYFTPVGGNWVIHEGIKDRITFKTMNLMGKWLPFPVLDLVLLRNVMIYFDVPAKRAVLQKIGKLLDPQGYLMLGGSETTINLDDRYEGLNLSGVSCFRLKKNVWEGCHANS